MENIELTGVELIAAERNEQIEKHGFYPNYDDEYDEGELLVAAQAAILGNPKAFPKSWLNSPYIDKICAKPQRERLIIAGALIAAEIDRIDRIPIIKK